MQRRTLAQGWALAASLALALAVTGCGRSTPSEGVPVALPPVSNATAQVCGDDKQYPATPKRAVTHDAGITEMFIYLGLGDRLIGYSGIPSNKEVAPEVALQLSKLPNLSRQGMNLETLVNSGADFVFGGWSYGFRPGGVTPDLLAQHGIASYVLTESCIRVKPRDDVFIEDAFADMRALGHIFRVEAQAEQRVGQLQAELTQLREQLAPVAGSTQRSRLFVFDSGEKLPTTSGRYGMPRAIAHEAGAVNIFDDIPSNWPKGNWEDVVLRDPEWIVIVDYGQPNAAGKIAFLNSKPELANVSAIRHQRFFVMTYAEATPGPRNVQTAQRLAAALHPELGIRVSALNWGQP